MPENSPRRPWVPETIGVLIVVWLAGISYVAYKTLELALASWTESYDGNAGPQTIEHEDVVLAMWEILVFVIWPALIAVVAAFGGRRRSSGGDARCPGG